LAPRNDGFKDFVLDQLSDFPGLTCRAMFGGYGLSQRETFFGIIHKGRLYFKVTPATLSPYKEQGMKPFRPNAKQTLKSFYEVPVDVLEDRDQLTSWARQAISNIAVEDDFMGRLGL
jgi:DNA transformation protein